MKKFVKYLLITILLLAIYVVVNLCFIRIGYGADGTYYSPIGRFQLPVPVSSAMGGKTTEKKGSVSFIDDMCSLYRIDYGRLGEHEKRLFKKMGREKYLSSFFTNVYLDTFLRRRMPELKIDFEEYLGDEKSGILYAQLDAPKGSVCTISSDGAPPMRLDAKRGIVVVVYGDRIFVITTELWQLPLPSGITLKELHAQQEQQLKENTMSFMRTIKVNL